MWGGADQRTPVDFAKDIFEALRGLRNVYVEQDGLAAQGLGVKLTRSMFIGLGYRLARVEQYLSKQGPLAFSLDPNDT
jgi:hypothetical protein